jgi:carboxyl-terminal processing protease
MRRTKRQWVPALLALLLPILLVAGIWLGGHPEDLPGFARSALVSDQGNQVIDEAIDTIAHDYYRPIPKSRLASSSIAGLVSSLGDRFSRYLSPNEFHEFNSPPSFTGIGVQVGPNLVGLDPGHPGLLIARVFSSSPAARAGLKPGEVIVGVDGRGLAHLDVSRAAALIKGMPGTNVELAISAPPRGNSNKRTTRTIKVARATVSEPVVASESRTVHGVKLGVVALATFSPGAHGEVREAVERALHAGAKGIVLDLRGNGGGLVEEAELIASIFIDKGTIVSTRGRALPTDTLKAVGDAIPASIPVVVLVDSGTASAAEIVSAALQDHHRATVVGVHTYGKGVFQEEEPLTNGGALDITVGEYFTPNGRNLGGGGIRQGAGVIPEVMVPGVDTSQGLAVALSTLAAKVK